MSEPKPQPDDREQRLADALASFVDLEAQGKTVEIDVFCRSHADLNPELGDQLRAIASLANSSAGNRPERLSGHKILDEIGSGGMGRVFLAMDEGLGRRVAIKTLAPRFAGDSQLRTRFMQEARSMARLSHSNVVRIYNLGQSGEMPHFVMEYVDGAPLTQAAQPLTFRQKAEIMHKIAGAVEFLHHHNVIHRDLKPGNILVGPDLEPKLLDFGLALHLGDRDRLTRAGVAVGTPRYFSPEQARADSPLGPASDVFSLGTIFYELLTEALPFRGDTLDEEIETICNKDPVLPRRINAAIPGELQNICMKALEKNPEDRYGSAREMAQDIERFLAGEQPLAAPASYSRLMTHRIERHVRELEGWKQDEIISNDEFRALRNGYNRLIERDDAWIMEARRLTVSQVTLYLGAWISVVGAALLVLFELADANGTLKVAIGASATVPMLFLGVRCWKEGSLRTGVAFLLASCFLLPIVILVAMGEYNILSVPENDDMVIERLRFPSDSRYFYPIAVGFTWITLTGLAATHMGYLEHVDAWRPGVVRMQREYLFLTNAGIYLALQWICGRLPWNQLQSVARAFRFVIPTHVLLSLWFLERSTEASQFEVRIFQVLLPCVAAAFVYLSIPRQMKNFFVWGMVFLAIGIVDLQNDIFADRRGWLVTLMMAGLLVMLVATNYAGIRMAASRWIRRGNKEHE
jgi:serine/threonine protein kinase